MRYLLDTGSASDLINRRAGVHVRARKATAEGDRVGVCMPVVGELFAGVELSASGEKNRVRLVRALKSLFVWPFDQAAAEEYGRIFAALRRKGRPIQQIDMQNSLVPRWPRSRPTKAKNYAPSSSHCLYQLAVAASGVKMRQFPTSGGGRRGRERAGLIGSRVVFSFNAPRCFLVSLSFPIESPRE